MKIENAGQSYMLSYSAEGATERASPKISIAYVAGHELGHASGNRLKALARGEEVQQDISYRVVLENNRLIAVGGTTKATFIKKAKGSSSDTPKRQKTGPPAAISTNYKPSKPASPVATTYYIKNILSLKIKKAELEQKYLAISSEGLHGDGNRTDNPSLSVTGSETESAIPLIDPLKAKSSNGNPDAFSGRDEKTTLMDFLMEMEKEKLKRQIRHLDSEIKDLGHVYDADETLQLTGGSAPGGQREREADIQNTVLKSDIYAGSFNFVDKEVPPIAFIDAYGSALRVKEALDVIKDVKDRNEPVVIRRLNFKLYKIKLSEWDTLASRLTDLYKSNIPLLSREGFNINTAQSSDENVLTATASSDSLPGTYMVKVTRLAKAHQIASGIFADAGASLNLSGTININDFDVTISKTDSLYAIADRINYGEDINRNGVLDFGSEKDVNNNRIAESGEDFSHNGMLDTWEDADSDNKLDLGTANHGVTASIAGGRLVLTANETGKPIVMKDDNNVLKELGILSYDIYPLNVTFKNEMQAVQKSKIIVDGTEYERNSNEITDILQGLAIDLENTSDPEVTLTVSTSVETALSNIKNLVDDYNKTMMFLNDRINYTKGLYKDSVAQMIKVELKHNLTDDVSTQPPDFNNIKDVGMNIVNSEKNRLNEPALMNLYDTVKDGLKKGISMPFLSSGSIYSSMEDLGIKTKEDDTLQIDEETLKSVLGANSKEVSALFNTSEGISARLRGQLERELDASLGAIVFQKSALGGFAGSLDYFMRLQKFNETLDSLNRKGQLFASNISIVV
ncbi:MAG: flagellar filament capping protein FliD [Nitrospirae bacterium]|nr:flagellar filament capping protein FliD [Nitrospirota bacterium]